MSDDNNIIKPARVESNDDQAEQGRRAELSQQVMDKFTEKDNTYRYKELPGVVAFTDHGDRLSTDLDNDDVAVAMTRLAESRGWTVIHAEGSQSFYKSVERTQQTIIEQQQSAKAPAQSNSIAVEQQATEANDKELQRRQAIVQAVNEQYRVAGSKYYFKDQAGNVNQLAFKDTGNKLYTSLNTERVTRSLVDLAESKGWTELKVSGHKEFKRQIWRSATERGIEVRGYTPDEKDLASVSDKALKNTIESAPTPAKQSRKDNSKSRNVSGLLVEHGPAPYQNKPKNTQSYFVTLETDDGQRTVWGVELGKAVSESNAKPGDNISLQHKGAVPVTVKGRNGEVINTTRNAWVINRNDKREVIAAVASAVASKDIKSAADRQRVAQGIQARMDAHKGEMPQIEMYDNKAAPTVAPEPAKARTKAPELIR